MKRIILTFLALLLSATALPLANAGTASAATRYHCYQKTSTSKPYYFTVDDELAKKFAIYTFVRYKHCKAVSSKSHFDDIQSSGVRIFPAYGGNLCGPKYGRLKNIKFNPDSIAGHNYGERTLSCYWSGATKTLGFATKRYWNGAGGGNRCLGAVLTDVNAPGLLLVRDRSIYKACVR